MGRFRNYIHGLSQNPFGKIYKSSCAYLCILGGGILCALATFAPAPAHADETEFEQPPTYKGDYYYDDNTWDRVVARCMEFAYLEQHDIPCSKADDPEAMTHLPEKVQKEFEGWRQHHTVKYLCEEGKRSCDIIEHNPESFNMQCARLFNRQSCHQQFNRAAVDLAVKRGWCPKQNQHVQACRKHHDKAAPEALVLSALFFLNRRVAT